MSHLRVVAVLVLLAGCDGAVSEPIDPETGVGGGSPGAAGGSGGGSPGAAGGSGGGSPGAAGGSGGGSPGAGGSGGGSPSSTDGLPCEVAATLATQCSACHGLVPAGGAS